MKYLGVRLVQDINKISEINLANILKECQRLMKTWVHLPLSIFSRVNLVKKVVLPKSTFLFNVIPLHFENHL